MGNEALSVHLSGCKDLYAHKQQGNEASAKSRVDIELREKGAQIVGQSSRLRHGMEGISGGAFKQLELLLIMQMMGVSVSKECEHQKREKQLSGHTDKAWHISQKVCIHNIFHSILFVGANIQINSE
jgi:hypothetical protein